MTKQPPSVRTWSSRVQVFAQDGAVMVRLLPSASAKRFREIVMPLAQYAVDTEVPSTCAEMLSALEQADALERAQAV